MIKPMIERHTGDGDAKIAHVAKIRQAHATGWMFLTEDHLLCRTMGGAPTPDAALQRAAHARAQIGMPAAQLLENADRAQRRGGL